MHNDNMAAYAQRWFEGVASHERIERAFAWYTRYMARFLDKYDCVVTNGPALDKRMRARGLQIDASMPLGIERGAFLARSARRDGCARRCSSNAICRRTGICCSGSGGTIPKSAGRW